MADRSLLRPLGVPGFRLLFLSAFASSFGTLLAAVALAVDVKDRTDSGLWVGGLMVVEFVPAILVGILVGPLLDRLSRRGIMVAADVARAAVFCALPFVHSAGAIVALAAVAGLATGFFRPAALAGIPNLVPDEDLAAANSLIQVVENVSWTVGPLVGGVLTAAAGPHLAYWVNAVSFVVSAVLILRIPQRLLQTTTALTRGHWRDLADGFAVVRRSRALLTVVIAWSVASVGLGLVNVGEVFLAKDTFHAGDFGYGLLYGAIGAGLVVGSVIAPEIDRRFGIGALYAGAIAVMALGFGLGAVSPNVWVAAVCCVVAGIGNGATSIANPLLVQRGAPDAVRGRALTLIISLNYTVLGGSFVIAGPIVDALGARWAWGLAAAVIAVASVVALAIGRGESRPRESSLMSPSRRTFKQASLRRLQRDPLGELAHRAAEQGDLATFGLGRQRVLSLVTPELVEEAFVRHGDEVGKRGRARRWWLRRPPSFVRGELFETHDPEEHARARRTFAPEFNRGRAEAAAGPVADVLERLCDERAGRGGAFDLTVFVQEALLAGMLAAAFGVEIGLDEAERFVALRNRAAPATAPVFGSTGAGLVDAFGHPGSWVGSRKAALALRGVLAEYLGRADSLQETLTRAAPRDPVRLIEGLVFSLVDAPSIVVAGLLRLGEQPELAAALRAELADGRLELCRGAALEGLRLGAGWMLGRVCHEPFTLESVRVDGALRHVRTWAACSFGGRDSCTLAAA